MEKQSTRKFLKLIVALVALFLLGASALMLASCNKDEHVHSYKSSVTTPATCSNPGVETFTCSCGAAYTQIIPATNDHAWEKIKVYANSCESEGWTVYECSVCHEQKQDDWTPKLDHKYEAVETVEATCTEDGYQIMQCSYCKSRYTDAQYSAEHKATGHKWIVNESPADPADLTDAEGWKVVKAADCLNAAQLERECSVCHEKEQKTGAAATGHKIKDGDKLVDPTELCKVNDKLVDAEGNKIYAFECVNENCPVSVVVDARGTKKHYVEAVEHELKTVYEHINCEDTDDDTSKIYQICENCDTYGDKYDASKNKVTEVEAAGHDYNTVQTDGKTSVVVCIEDKGLNTQAKYLEYMRSVVDFATFQANKTAYAKYWSDVADENPGATGQVSDTDTTKTLAISRVCARCGAVTVANGHNYVIAKYVDGSFTEYEKDEEGALVDYSKEVTVASMNCRYVRICSGCGDVTNRGTHKNVSAVSCRAPGVCADCGRDVEAQKSHIYVNVSVFVKDDGTFKSDATFKLPDGTDAKAIYNAWKKVSATETWMVPVNGDCDSKSTDVTVCAQCLVDAAKGTDVAWNQATERPENGIPTDAVANTNAYVITSEFSHDYQPVYFDLDAKDTTAQSIPAYNTDCQIGFKTAYICSKCGEVFTNVPVANDPDTKPADKNVEEDKDDTNEAKNNKLPDEGLPQVYTDANGFVIDSTKVSNKVDFQEEELAAALAAVVDNKGQHILYLVKDFDDTAGYVAPTCATVAKVPYYCLNCGQIIVLDATASGADKDKPVNAPELTYNIANEIVDDDAFDPQSKKNSYGYTAEQVDALKAAVQKAAGLKSTDDLVTVTEPTKLVATNHAGKAYGCGTHCQVKDVSGNYICAGFDTDKDGTVESTEVEAIGTSEAAHSTVNVTYSLIDTVEKYYSNYTLKIANVGMTSKNPADTTGDINNYITSFEDTTKVSVCGGNKYEVPEYKTDFKAGTSEGKFLVLVDANNKAYAFKNTTTNNLVFYYESTANNQISNIDETGDGAVEVKSDDIFFVGFTVGATSTLPVAAPVTASDEPSLKLALNNNAPETVKENGVDVTVLTVSLAADIIGVSEIPQPVRTDAADIDRVVYDLNGHKLTTTQTDNFSVTDDVVFQNGSLEFSKVMLDEGTASMAKVSISVGAHGKLTLDNVKLTTAGSGLLMSTNQYPTPSGDTTDNCLTIKDSTLVIKGHYGVGTNATNSDYIKGAVGLVIDNSTITMNPDEYGVGGKGDVKDNCALFINVPSHVTVTGSTLTANRQVVMVRGGELKMSDSTIELVKDDEVTGDLNVNWGQGINVPHAAMVLGNDDNDSTNAESVATAYQYKTTVILDNVTFNVDASDYTVVVASDYSDDTLETIAEEDGLEKGEVPVMVYFDGGNCVNDKQIDFVNSYDKGTIQLIDCGDASGIY